MSFFKRDGENTSFETIYDTFFSMITDDMYMEWSPEETYQDAENIFMSCISKFEFPKFQIYDYSTDNEGKKHFNFTLSGEEIIIFAHLMLVEWVGRQLASVDVTRQAYSSRDFEFTSQANHLDKLIKLKESFTKDSIKLQRLYNRRKIDSNGIYVPNYSGFGGKNNAN